jgi:nicotinate-nucleotide adenylyltransferase
MYTIDVLTLLKEENPENEFLFCIGTDLLGGLKTWKKVDELLSNFEMIILNRPQYEVNKDLLPEKHRLLPTNIDASSTNIRNRIKNNRASESPKVNLGISGLTANSVIKYIKDNNLYQ